MLARKGAILRILHVTDAYAAGVKSAIDALVFCQLQDANSVTVLFLERQETLLDSVGTRSEAKYVSFGKLSISNLLRLTAFLFANCNDFDFVHLHSSRIGLLGRLVARIRSSTHFAYSPHGYSFLRRDVTHFHRLIFRQLETTSNLISRVPVIAVSEFEYSLAQRTKAAKAFLLHNVVEVDTTLYRVRNPSDCEKPTVAFVARNSPAKDPEMFVNIARLLSHHYKFIWIGTSVHDAQFGDVENHVELLGFKPRSEALCHLAKAHYLIVTSLWESLPMNIIEAQMLGVVVLTRNTLQIPELVQPRATGFVFGNIDEAVAILLGQELLSSYHSIALRAKQNAEFLFSSRYNRNNWLKVYSLIRAS